MDSNCWAVVPIARRSLVRNARSRTREAPATLHCLLCLRAEPAECCPVLSRRREDAMQISVALIGRLSLKTGVDRRPKILIMPRIHFFKML